MCPGCGRVEDAGGLGALLAQQLFSDFVSEVQPMVAEDDCVAAHFLVRGRHTGDFLGLPVIGREFEFSCFAIYRIANGQLAEAWNGEETLG